MAGHQTEDFLKDYLSEAGKIPLLGRQEEVDLAKIIELGEKARKKFAAAKKQKVLLGAEEKIELAAVINSACQATQALISANLRLVVSIAKEYSQRHRDLDLADSIQEGNLGLFRAVKKWDWRRGNRFSTYATSWIINFIQTAEHQQGKTIRIPAYMLQKVYKYRTARSKLLAMLGRKPLLEEIAKQMGLDVKEVQNIQKIAFSIYSLETLISEDSENSSSDLIEDKHAPSSSETDEDPYLRQILSEAFAKLPKREQCILSMKFGLEDGNPHTLAEIADELKVTGERIRQIAARAIQRLRRNKTVSKLF